MPGGWTHNGANHPICHRQAMEGERHWLGCRGTDHNCAMLHLFHRLLNEALVSGNQIKGIGSIRSVHTELLRTTAVVEVLEVSGLHHHDERLVA